MVERLVVTLHKGWVQANDILVGLVIEEKAWKVIPVGLKDQTPRRRMCAEPLRRRLVRGSGSGLCHCKPCRTQAGAKRRGQRTDQQQRRPAAMLLCGRPGSQQRSAA